MSELPTHNPSPDRNDQYLSIPSTSTSRPQRSSTPAHTSSPRSSSLATSLHSFTSDLTSTKTWRSSPYRHSLGITLLLATVFLWVASNFLASTIFADNTYSRPYFVTYINTSFFEIPLGPVLWGRWRRDKGEFVEVWEVWRRMGRWHGAAGKEENGGAYEVVRSRDEDVENADEEVLLQKPSAELGRLHMDDSLHSISPLQPPASSKSTKSPSTTASHGQMTLLETMHLSLEFCLLWFSANYLTASCLSYTTVASSTILTSTSSVFTLLIGVLFRVETFTIRKLLAVLASLSGIALISSIDLSGGSSSDENRGSFPFKTSGEIAVGDAMAMGSAVLYGFYAVLMKKRIGDEGRVDMPLFFGLVGLLNVLLLWPGIIVLHYTGIEEFLLPPQGRVLAIVLINSATSLVSDFTWAWSMLLTSPLVTTVGLSMTIPLSLIGQMLLDQQYASFTYWVGAAIVVLSFVFVNREEANEEEEELGSRGLEGR